MYEYLIDHAVEHVWCGANQDNQFIVAPKKISPNEGCLNKVFLFGEFLDLPFKNERFHVFQLGQLDPSSLGLDFNENKKELKTWMSFSDSVNKNNLEITIYSPNGLNYPRVESYFIFLKDKALIFAVKDQPFISNQNKNERLFFRFYKNYFFESDGNSLMKVLSGVFKPRAMTDFIAIEEFKKSFGVQSFQTRFYVNGLLSNKTVIGFLKDGDVVEWVSDASVRKVETYKVSELHKFKSELDNKYKYLIITDSEDFKKIDYQDDIDIHLLFVDEFGFYDGVYYNRNFSQNHRMVTHQSYSVCSEIVESLKDFLKSTKTPEQIKKGEFYLQVTIRNAGTNRELGYEANRLLDWCRLDRETKVRALIGIDSVMDEWRADTLEKGFYTNLMRLRRDEITIEKVQSSYGYDACSVILCESPLKVKSNSGTFYVDVPAGLQDEGTFYEFDKEGKLLGYFYNSKDSEYRIKNLDCSLVEAVVGKPNRISDVIYGVSEIKLPPTIINFRVYLCRTFDGVPNYDWQDITNSEKYFIKENTLNWSGSNDGQYLCVKSDCYLTTGDLLIKPNLGVLTFTLTEQDVAGEQKPMTIEPLQLDVWLNGYKLIDGLDYRLKFPNCFIVNKTHLKQPADSSEQTVHFRARGLCADVLKIEKAEDTGWVLNGRLSNNEVYDLRDGRVIQVNIGGKIFDKKDLIYEEDKIDNGLLNRLNGQPYQIKSIFVPLKNHVEEDTYSLREKSKLTNKRVSDFMTKYFYKDKQKLFSAILNKYPLVSPFFSHLVSLLKNKLLVLPRNSFLTLTEVAKICSPFETLLEFDPLSETFETDFNFVYIVPHGNENILELDFISYKFLTQALEIYANGKIKISDHFSIKKE